MYRYQEGLELDEAMLKALLQGYHLCSTDQLNLALSWNRVDIARCTVFAAPQEWPPGKGPQRAPSLRGGCGKSHRLSGIIHRSWGRRSPPALNGVNAGKFARVAERARMPSIRRGPGNGIISRMSLGTRSGPGDEYNGKFACEV